MNSKLEYYKHDNIFEHFKSNSEILNTICDYITQTKVNDITNEALSILECLITLQKLDKVIYYNIIIKFLIKLFRMFQRNSFQVSLICLLSSKMKKLLIL